MHYDVQRQQKSQITDISTLQFIHKLRNFMHIISMQNDGTAITSSCSGSIPVGYVNGLSGHIWCRLNLKEFESGTSLVVIPPLMNTHYHQPMQDEQL